MIAMAGEFANFGTQFSTAIKQDVFTPMSKVFGSPPVSNPATATPNVLSSMPKWVKYVIIVAIIAILIGLAYHFL